MKVILKGEDAENLANCFGWPVGIFPKFEFTNEYGQLYGSYDAGLNYEKDGFTFEWEWEITNPMK